MHDFHIIHSICGSIQLLFNFSRLLPYTYTHTHSQIISNFIIIIIYFVCIILFLFPFGLYQYLSRACGGKQWQKGSKQKKKKVIDKRREEEEQEKKREYRIESKKKAKICCRQINIENPVDIKIHIRTRRCGIE